MLHGFQSCDLELSENLSAQFSSDRRLLARIAGDEQRVYSVLSHIHGIAKVSTCGEREPGVFEYALEPDEGADFRRTLFTTLAKEGFPLLGLKSMEMTLEEVFISLTREQISQTARKGGDE